MHGKAELPHELPEHPSLAEVSFHYLWISCLILMLFGSLVRLSSKGLFQDPSRQGGVSSASPDVWPKEVWHALTLAVLILFVVPFFVILLAMILGVILSCFEGVTWVHAFNYIIAALAQLPEGLCDWKPQSFGGSMVTVIVIVWGMLLSLTAFGMAAMMPFTRDVVERTPRTRGALARALMIYIPMILIVASLAAGGLLALSEGWSWYNGFLFMMGAFCGLPDPLIETAPVTGLGQFIEIICELIEITVGGALVGIVCAHPVVGQIIAQVEKLIPKTPSETTKCCASQPRKGGASHEQHSSSGQSKCVVQGLPAAPDQRVQLVDLCRQNVEPSSDEKCGPYYGRSQCGREGNVAKHCIPEHDVTKKTYLQSLPTRSVGPCFDFFEILMPTWNRTAHATNSVEELRVENA